MDFLLNLPKKTLISLLLLILAKTFGFLAMLATYISFTLASVLGAVWGVLIIATIVMSIKAWYENRNDELAIYRKLKAKYESNV